MSRLKSVSKSASKFRASQLIWLVRAGFAVLVVTVCILVFGPFGGDERLFGLNDKEAHAMAFYTLTAMGLMAMPRLRKFDVALVVFAFGGLVEIIQPYVGRDGDVMDWLADGIGVSLAIVPMIFEKLRMKVRGGRQTENPGRRRSDQPDYWAKRFSRPAPEDRRERRDTPRLLDVVKASRNRG